MPIEFKEGGSGYSLGVEEELHIVDATTGELVQKIDETIQVVDESLAKLNDAIIEEEYPLLVYESKSSTGFMLGSLLAHLGYHLGQINYHRRLLDK